LLQSIFFRVEYSYADFRFQWYYENARIVAAA
jgi:hypothetical protein